MHTASPLDGVEDVELATGCVHIASTITMKVHCFPFWTVTMTSSIKSRESVSFSRSDPRLLNTLVKKCWESTPKNRPTIIVETCEGMGLVDGPNGGCMEVPAVVDDDIKEPLH